MSVDDEKRAEARKARLEDKKDVSGRIGETSRFIAFGLVALTFTIHGSESGISKKILTDYESLINLAGVLGCLSIVSDYLQYMCGYFSNVDALKRKENDYAYDRKNVFYKGRFVFFWAKQVFAFFGALLVIYSFGLIAIQ